MTKSFIYTFLLLFTVIFGTAQQKQPDSIQQELISSDGPRDIYIGSLDSLRHELITTNNDTIRLDLANILWEYYIEVKPDSALYFGEQQLILAKKLNLKLDEAMALNFIGFALKGIGNYPRALQALLSALAIAEDPKSKKNILPARYLDRVYQKNISSEYIRLSSLAHSHLALGSLYGNTGNHQKQIFHLFQTIQLAEEINSQFLLCMGYLSLGDAYYSLNRVDSALLFARGAYDLSLKYERFKRYVDSALMHLGRIELRKGNRLLAKEYFHKAAAANDENHSTLTDSYLSLANLYLQSGENDSSLYFARKGFIAAQTIRMPRLMLKADTTLAAIYRTTNNIDCFQIPGDVY